MDKAAPQRRHDLREGFSGLRLTVVKLSAARLGFVLQPRRWAVERGLACASRFRRLARDYERLNATLAGFHYVAFALVALHTILPLPWVL